MNNINNEHYFEKVNFEEFQTYFNNYKREAFRIEFLQQYLVEGEQALFQKSKTGKLSDEEFLIYQKDWLAFIKGTKENNKTIQRIHAVKEPYSSYVNFEINFSYKCNLEYGEKINLIKYDDEISNLLLEYPYLSDFWLFDNEVCIFLDYDNNGNFLGIKKLLKEFIPEIVKIKQTLLNQSFPLIIK